MMRKRESDYESNDGNRKLSYRSATLVVFRRFQIAEVHDCRIAANGIRRTNGRESRTVDSSKFNAWIVFEMIGGGYELRFRFLAVTAPFVRNFL